MRRPPFLRKNVCLDHFRDIVQAEGVGGEFAGLLLSERFQDTPDGLLQRNAVIPTHEQARPVIAKLDGAGLDAALLNRRQFANILDHCGGPFLCSRVYHVVEGRTYSLSISLGRMAARKTLSCCTHLLRIMNGVASLCD